MNQKNGDPSTDAEDAYFSELIASLPDEAELPDAPARGGSALSVGTTEDSWKPRHTLEAAIERLSPEIRETLESRLGGKFREVRRYRPSRSLELESADVSRAPASDDSPPAENELDDD